MTELLSLFELPDVSAAIPASLLPDDAVLSAEELSATDEQLLLFEVPVPEDAAFWEVSLLPVGSPAFQLSDGAQFQVISFPSDVATIVPCSSVRNTDMPAARRRFSTSA